VPWIWSQLWSFQIRKAPASRRFRHL
jgi:hypothetical protein